MILWLICFSDGNEYTCSKHRCPARFWFYNTGICIFSPNHKPHNQLDNAKTVVNRDAAMGKNKQEASKLKLENGRLPSPENIVRKNIIE